MRNPDDKGKHLPRTVGGFAGAIVGAFWGILYWGIVVPITVLSMVVTVPFLVLISGSSICNRCGEEVGKLTRCSNCYTPVRYPLGTTPGELTPSDLVLLEMMPWSNKELHGVVEVVVDDPPSAGIEGLLATALLANEEAGVLRLDIANEKVVAAAVGKAPEWPTGSLERSLYEHCAGPPTAKRLHGRPVADIIHAWIGTTSPDPESRAVNHIMAMMVHRTLMEVEVDKKRVLKLFTTTSSYYVLPERTSALVMQPSVRLFEECRRTRPDVRNRLIKDIAIGFGRRTILPSGD